MVDPEDEHVVFRVFFQGEKRRGVRSVNEVAAKPLVQPLAAFGVSGVYSLIIVQLLLETLPVE